jgi:probable poly-beta-1,6-N-acetyl-D-glucosamine export protein
MSQFLSYIHNLRGVAILFVVGVHARGSGFDWSSHRQAHDLVASLFDAQEGNGTVMFLFIAGFLFQHLTDRFDYKRYLRQKFKVIILPYIIISIPIILFRIHEQYQPWSLSEDFVIKPPIYQFFYHLLVGTHMSPFWFISTIIVFYITSPLLHAMDKPFFYKYIFPWILIAGMFTFRSEHNGNPLLSYLHYLPVYIAGMWASRYKKDILSMDLRYFWALSIVYIALTVMDLRGAFTGALDMTFEQVLAGEIAFNYYILRAIILCFMFTMLFYRLQFKRMSFIELLGDYSFGIFFIHFILITMARKIMETSYFRLDFTLLTYTAFFVFILLVSTAVVFLIKKLTGPYSRNLIGS